MLEKSILVGSGFLSQLAHVGDFDLKAHEQGLRWICHPSRWENLLVRAQFRYGPESNVPAL